ncbi:MAG: hypothetical protein Alis3KO_05450 [Aliiglaciecola sp.]
MHKKYSIPEKVSILLIYNTQLISLQELAEMIGVETGTLKNWDQEIGQQMFSFNDVSKAVISCWSEKPVEALLKLMRIRKQKLEKGGS